MTLTRLVILLCALATVLTVPTQAQNLKFSPEVEALIEKFIDALQGGDFGPQNVETPNKPSTVDTAAPQPPSEPAQAPSQPAQPPAEPAQPPAQPNTPQDPPAPDQSGAGNDNPPDQGNGGAGGDNGNENGDANANGNGDGNAPAGGNTGADAGTQGDNNNDNQDNNDAVAEPSNDDKTPIHGSNSPIDKEDAENENDKDSKKPFNWKLIAIIGGAVVGVLVILGLIRSRRSNSGSHHFTPATAAQPAYSPSVQSSYVGSTSVYSSGDSVFDEATSAYNGQNERSVVSDYNSTFSSVIDEESMSIASGMSFMSESDVYSTISDQNMEKPSFISDYPSTFSSIIEDDASVISYDESLTDSISEYSIVVDDPTSNFAAAAAAGAIAEEDLQSELSYIASEYDSEIGQEDDDMMSQAMSMISLGESEIASEYSIDMERDTLGSELDNMSEAPSQYSEVMSNYEITQFDEEAFSVVDSEDRFTEEEVDNRGTLDSEISDLSSMASDYSDMTSMTSANMQSVASEFSEMSIDEDDRESDASLLSDMSSVYSESNIDDEARSTNASEYSDMSSIAEDRSTYASEYSDVSSIAESEDDDRISALSEISEVSSMGSYEM